MAKTSLLILLSLSLLTISCTKEKNFKFDKIVRNPSLNSFDKDFNEDIEGTKIFAENFINAYLDVIKDVHPDFKDSFKLFKGHLSARVIFSSVKESFLYIYPAEKNEFKVDCAVYPVQMILFSGIDGKAVEEATKMEYTDILQLYDTARVVFILDSTSAPFFIERLTFRLSFPKVVSITNHSIVVFNDIITELKTKEGKTCTIGFPNVGILINEEDFGWAAEKAKGLGKNLAKGEKQHLFITSEFFRKALLDKKLSSMANEIMSKDSRAQNDPYHYKYPSWEFEYDKEKLRREVIKNKIDTSYIDKLLPSARAKIPDGRLLWYYSNHWKFSLQWIIINIFLIFLIILFVKFRQEQVIKYVIQNGIILAINSWAFASRPYALDMKYCLLPSMLMLIAIGLSIKVSRNR